MKKLFILLTGIVAICAGTFAGCGVKNSEQTFEPQPEPRTVTQEENGETEEKPSEQPDEKPDCKKRIPKVILRRGHGNAVGFYGGISDGKFFFIRFGDGDCGDFEVYPQEPIPVPLPDEIPAD